MYEKSKVHLYGNLSFHTKWIFQCETYILQQERKQLYQKLCEYNPIFPGLLSKCSKKTVNDDSKLGLNDKSHYLL